jgi:hypothetical protein
MSYFAAYEVTKKALTPAGSSPSELNLGAIILAGGTAGVAMWSIAIPPDVRAAPFAACRMFLIRCLLLGVEITNTNGAKRHLYGFLRLRA